MESVLAPLHAARPMPSPELTLYTYWRSGAAYRVRIGLNVKRLPCVQVPIDLVHAGGGQHGAGYVALNPQHLVPTLRHGDVVLRQSLAILEYLEDTWPAPALLPQSARDRARVRALAQVIACDIHPLHNRRVMQYLEGELGTPESARTAWMQHWIRSGLNALETLLGEAPAGDFCHGNAPTLADCCLIPQLYSARRFGLDPAVWPRSARIESACLALPAFADAAPERQMDAPAAVKT